jgi:uncharacterized protein YecT (DUF1311 family)
VGYAMKWTAMILALLLVSPVMAARAAGPDAVATNTIEDCIKTAASAGKPMSAAERCIGIVSNPCLDDNKTKSTADMNACVDRERAVWDDMLNETYRLLAAKLDADQKGKLRDMQRAWIASRDKTCGFYWDFYQGTMASPMASVCVNRETALRTLFLLSFLYDDK